VDPHREQRGEENGAGSVSSALAHPNARSALRARLGTLPGGLLPPEKHRAYEGFEYQPETGQKYIEDRLLVVGSTPISLGVIHHQISYIMTLKFPWNKGTAEIEALAGALCDHFKVGTNLTYGADTVLCEQAARKGGLVTDNGWLIATVEVRGTLWTTD
jgi:hypothetical protein